MRSSTLAVGLLIAGLVHSQLASAELVMSAPAEVAAGSASSLLLQFSSTGDRDPETQPTATVAGSNIRIDLQDECVEVSCDAITDRYFRVDLPPLEEGEYTVTAYSGPESDEPRGSFTLAVGAESEVSMALPAEGFWMPVAMPGTGLHLQHRGDILAVSQFDQVAGDAVWRLDAVPLQGDSAIVVLRGYVGGSCFGCAPHQAPVQDQADVAMRLRFDSARTAMADLADGTTVALVNLPFGAEYTAAELAPDDEVFGSLALPDLAGDWAVPALRSEIVTFGAAQQLDDGTLRFFGAVDHMGPLTVDCVPQDAEQPAGCWLSDTWPSPPLLRIAFAPLGDVTEDHVRFHSEGWDEVLHAVRIPQDGTESSTPPLPAEGFWMIPGEPGTGMHFQHRGTLLAVSLFDFVGGESHWRLGVAPLSDGSVEVALHSYRDGSCFGCTPHAAPEQDSDPPMASIVFESARRATVDLGGGTVVPLVNLPFGADYVDVQLPGNGDEQFGPLALPDLSGTWAFDLADSNILFPHIVMLQGPIMDGDTVRFERDPAEGERFALICSPGGEAAHAGCELRMGNLAIGTPPPGWYPFARLGDIEEDRIRFVGGAGPVSDWPVFHAVRVPHGD